MMKKYPKAVGALTIIQPWAYVIIRKGKNVENRQKNSHFRGTIAIHASKTNSKAWFADSPIKVDRNSVPFGAIIGLAELVDVITRDRVTAKTRKWFKGKYGYVLANVMPLKKPVPTKGKRGIWRLREKTLAECFEQLSPRQKKRLIPFEKLTKK